MTPKKIAELKRRVAELRGQSQVPSRVLEKLAKAIGREPRKGGKHPMFELPGRRPLAIPHHSKPMKNRTKESILTQLEGDIAAQEEEILNEGARNGGSRSLRSGPGKERR
jgi:hypothetical protein